MTDYNAQLDLLEQYLEHCIDRKAFFLKNPLSAKDVIEHFYLTQTIITDLTFEEYKEAISLSRQQRPVLGEPKMKFKFYR